MNLGIHLILLPRFRSIQNFSLVILHLPFPILADNSTIPRICLLHQIEIFSIGSFKCQWRRTSTDLLDMALKVVKNMLQGIKEKGLGTFFKGGGYLRCIPDGNLLQTKIHNIGATLVGVDKFGNKYYENLEGVQYGRHRWVEYAQKGRYNASQVPAEWHGWLHYTTDHTGDELLMLKPKRYGIDHKENFSGEGEQYIYHSKGHALHPGQRDWTRYQPWQPTKNE